MIFKVYILIYIKHFDEDIYYYIIEIRRNAVVCMFSFIYTLVVILFKQKIAGYTATH